MRPPFVNGTPSQGNQSPLLPTTSYRSALAALDSHCKSGFGGNGFAALAPTDQDKVLQSLEKGEIKFDGFDGKVFFELLLQNTMEGFFADPIYGGNRDMAGWKLIGFPGARYDYRDHVSKHNQPYPLPPVSIMGRSDWTIME
jgi:gluconate 2-dehydrogenase gamma chain